MGIRWAGSFGKQANEQRDIKSMKTEYLNNKHIIVGPAVCKAREAEAGGRNRGRQQKLVDQVPTKID
jgi:hypothetical protein